MLTQRIIGALTFQRGVYAEVEADKTFTATAWILVVRLRRHCDGLCELWLHAEGILPAGTIHSDLRLCRVPRRSHPVFASPRQVGKPHHLP